MISDGETNIYENRWLKAKSHCTVCQWNPQSDKADDSSFSGCDPVDHQLIHMAKGKNKKQKPFSGPAVSSGHDWLLGQNKTSTPIIRSGLPAFVVVLWRMLFCLFEKLLVSVRSAKKKKKDIQGSKMGRSQSGDNAFCHSFTFALQPDPPSILTLYLAKRRQGTHWFASFSSYAIPMHSSLLLTRRGHFYNISSLA